MTAASFSSSNRPHQTSKDFFVYSFYLTRLPVCFSDWCIQIITLLLSRQLFPQTSWGADILAGILRQSNCLLWRTWLEVRQQGRMTAGQCVPARTCENNPSRPFTLADDGRFSLPHSISCPSLPCHGHGSPPSLRPVSPWVVIVVVCPHTSLGLLFDPNPGGFIVPSTPAPSQTDKLFHSQSTVCCQTFYTSSVFLWPLTWEPTSTPAPPVWLMPDLSNQPSVRKILFNPPHQHKHLVSGGKHRFGRIHCIYHILLLVNYFLQRFKCQRWFYKYC